MPLRDHFRPPISTKTTWEGFHGMWPAMIVQRLVPHLPDNFTAEPRVHLGSFFEIDVATFEGDQQPKRWSDSHGASGAATALWSPPEPTLTIDADFTEPFEYAVEIYDQNRGRTLVAAVEIVSPANKDRPASRRAFATKCAALVQRQICVTIVDLVTFRDFNLYHDVLERLGEADPAFDRTVPATYAVTCRARSNGAGSRLESWAYPLAIGQPLPTLPLYLTDEFAVALELEVAYEETCRSLRIL